MTIGSNWRVETVDASFSDYADHDSDQQDAWRDRYQAATEAAETAAMYQAAQAVLIAGIQAVAADHAADQQWDIANRQMEIAEDEYDRYKDFFICNEHKMADEACAITVPEADYATRANRSASDIRRAFNDERKKLNRFRSRYCMSDFTQMMKQLSASEARAIAAARDAAYRHEEAYVRALDDVRWGRGKDVFALGRGIQTGQSTMYANAMTLASDSLATRLGGINNFLGAASGGIQGMIQAHYAKRIEPSPFANAYAAQGPYMAPQSSLNFNIGGPNPLGQGATVSESVSRY